jgi:predicted dehydrogenase
MPKRHRVAIVGTGIGAAHLKGFLANPDRFEVAVICGRDQARTAALAAQAPGAETHLGLDDALLARADLDIISICTPPDLHLGPAIRALEAGRHVILEKPLVASLAEMDALEAAIARTGRTLMPIFQARFGNGLAQAKHILASGKAGRIHVATAETHWYRGPAYYATPWRGTIAHELGGAFITHAIHLHDMLTHLLGPVRSVSALVATRVNPIETEDTGAVALEMASGALVTLSVTLGSPQPSSRLRIVAEHVTITSGDAPAITATGPFHFAARDTTDRAWLDSLITEAPTGPEGFAEQFARFANTLDHGTPLPVTMAEARHSLELATAIYHSSKSGQRVTLPLAPTHPAYHGWASDLRR